MFCLHTDVLIHFLGHKEDQRRVYQVVYINRIIKSSRVTVKDKLFFLPGDEADAANQTRENKRECDTSSKVTFRNEQDIQSRKTAESHVLQLVRYINDS